MTKFIELTINETNENKTILFNIDDIEYIVKKERGTQISVTDGYYEAKESYEQVKSMIKNATDWEGLLLRDVANSLNSINDIGLRVYQEDF